mmetsp:Transcript_86152/g.216812  ORF Transcript_86152/g.216812 Transcript_86152/m.216812 type:complete len:145 (-) Transcript_86152:172-606(-)
MATTPRGLTLAICVLMCAVGRCVGVTDTFGDPDTNTALSHDDECLPGQGSDSVAHCALSALQLRSTESSDQQGGKPEALNEVEEEWHCKTPGLPCVPGIWGVCCGDHVCFSAGWGQRPRCHHRRLAWLLGVNASKSSDEVGSAP